MCRVNWARNITNPLTNRRPRKQEMATEVEDWNRVGASAANFFSYPRNVRAEASGDLLDGEKVIGIESYGRRTAAGPHRVKVR